MTLEIEERVMAALEWVSAWPPDLRPDDRYVGLADLDVSAYASAISRRLGGVPLRVGQSALVMGVASRLWSLTVIPVARDSVLPDPSTFVVREDDGAIALGVARPAGRLTTSYAELREAVLGVLRPIIEALPLAPRLLWGNVAASLFAVPRVHAVPEAGALVDSLLQDAPLKGELNVNEKGTARRRTCCLFYEVPGAGLCGDCVFDHPPGPST